MEELKLIMQTLSGLGETAKEGFIWWLVVDKLIPSVLWTTLWGAFIGLGFCWVKRVTNNARAEIEARFQKQKSVECIAAIRRVLDLYTYPSIQRDSSPEHYSSDEFDQTLKAVVALQKNTGRQDN